MRTPTLSVSDQEYQRRLLMDRSVPGRTGVSLPSSDVPEQAMPPEELLRDDLELPEVTEGEVVRYFSNLSQLNFSIDTNFYPLGSCSMKYNPRLNEQTAALPGFAQLHPRQSTSQIQGALELMYRLQGYLNEITGMDSASLAPLAGAHGELTGILMIRGFHQSKKQGHRTKMLVPDTAHGTNPASAAMGGYHVVSIPSDEHGNTDLDVLRREATADLAGIMFTLPTTLGLFDTNVVEMCRIVHEAGGLVYGDGANMNALLGRVKLGKLGFDVVHLNLHKTFSTPHGGGGPGAGPVCANETLAPYLPDPMVSMTSDGDYQLARASESIGRIGGFYGSFGMLVRAFTYITLLGAQGMRDISANANLNANYLRVKLQHLFALPYDRICMHEVIFSTLREHPGIRALDIAKRLLDFGFHAPTMYFPLVVPEALMIEPTETESKETLDAFINALQRINDEAAHEPELVQSAPHSTPVARLDEAKAARQPNLRWRHS
jgi:glycine dehydrogenase subunit 2